MPRVSNELNEQYYEPVCIGPIAQVDLSNSVTLGAAPATIAASGSWNSNVAITDGYKAIAAGVTSSQAGTLSVQRYLDTAGLVAQGAPVSVALSAGVAAVVNCMDGVPCQSFKVTITNSSGSVANITNFACLLNAQ